MHLSLVDFTPNPARAIWIEERFTDALLERLRPQILELTQSPAPISVFLNSSGGRPDAAEEILRLLRRTTQDGARARVITIATTRASSMAANFLSAGDFAIAHQDCTLLYHGGSWPAEDLVSGGEAGRRIAHSLPAFHEMNAAKLVQASVHRFLSIVSMYRPTFAEHRAEAGDPALTDLECFQAILRGKLLPAGQAVLDRAIPLWRSSDAVLLHFQKKLRRGRTVTKEHLRKLMLYSAVACECDPAAWDAGLPKICDQFYFLDSYFDFGALRDYVAGREPLPAGTDAEADYLTQFRFFFHAVCRALQEGENYLTPLDAVWFGLIDTVRADFTEA